MSAFADVAILPPTTYLKEINVRARFSPKRRTTRKSNDGHLLLELWGSRIRKDNVGEDFKTRRDVSHLLSEITRWMILGL